MAEFKLHLGCGRRLLAGYVNIDAAAREGAPLDLERDLLDLRFPDGSVAEIRHHHVFEHFHRYQAVALMAAWNAWLAPGGRLVTETPDFRGTCRRYLRTEGLVGVLRRTLRGRDPERERWTLLRHLFGSKEAPWASHLEGWDARTLGTLYREFGWEVELVEENRGELPCLTVAGRKVRSLATGEFEPLAARFLGRMVWNQGELEVWMAEARKAFARLQAAPLVGEDLLAGWRAGSGAG